MYKSEISFTKLEFCYSLQKKLANILNKKGKLTDKMKTNKKLAKEMTVRSQPLLMQSFESEGEEEFQRDPELI